METEEAHEYPNRLTDIARKLTSVYSKNELIIMFWSDLATKLCPLMRKDCRKLIGSSALQYFLCHSKELAGSYNTTRSCAAPITA